MNTSKFIRFNPLSPRLPRERKLCLVMIAKDEDEGTPPAVAVGFLRRTGRMGGAWWCVPRCGGVVTHYSDCLGESFPNRTQWLEMTDAALAKKKGPQ